MTLNFPNAAVNGQTYVGSNGVTYTFDGIKWVSAGSGGAVVPVTHLVNGTANLTLNSNGTVQFPGYVFPAADGADNQVLTTHGDGTVYWSNGGIGTANLVFVATTISTANNANITVSTNGNSWVFGADGSLTFPNINNAASPVISANSTDLFTAGEYYSEVYIADNDGVYINALSSSGAPGWKFDNTGSLYFPVDLSDDYTPVIGPTVIDLFTYGLEYAEIYLAKDSGLNINTNVAVHGTKTWQFSPDGKFYFPDGSYMVTAATGGGGNIINGGGSIASGNALVNGDFTFALNNDGTISMPQSTRLNSGGLGETGAAEFGTEVYKNPSNVVSSSQIYMGSGAGEFRSIYNNPDPYGITGAATLTYSGVEDVYSGKFSGVVSQTPLMDSQYSIAVDPATKNIIVGAATEAGHLISTDWSTGLGTLNSGLTINGIFTDTAQTVISGGVGGEGTGGATFAYSGITLRTGAGEAAHSYWIDEFGNYAFGEGFSFEVGLGTLHDSFGHVLVTGVVGQVDLETNGYFYDTLAMKYDANGELMSRIVYRLPNGTACGLNTGQAIDDHDTVYWMADTYTSPIQTLVGLRDTNGIIVSGNGSEIPVALKFSQISFYDIAALRSESEGHSRFMYLVGEGYGDNWTSTVVKINVFDYSIAWARNLSQSGVDVYGNQITVDPRDGSVYTLGYLLDPAKVYINKYAADGSSVWNHILAPAPDYATSQVSQIVRYNNGHLYTAILDIATNSTLVSKWTTEDCSHVWTTWIDQTTTHSTVLADLGFDDTGDVICMGWTADVASADSIYSLYYSKLADSNGAPVYHNVVTNTNPDRDWQPTGFRVGSVKNNLIALATMNYSNVTGQYRANAVTIQIPSDGSATGDYDGYSISDYTADFNSRTQTGVTLNTYSTDLTTDTDYAGSLVHSIVEVNTIALIDTSTTNRKQTLVNTAPGAVWQLAVDGSLTVPANMHLQTDYGDINITVAGQNWKFGEDGSLSVPGAIQSTAPGTVEYRSANDLDLTAANRVKITTSPLNLASFEPADFPGLAGRPGDVVFDYRSQKLRLFSKSGWGYVASTDGAGDIVLPTGGTVRNASGIAVAYQDQLPHDVSDLTDNMHLLPEVQPAFDVCIDGGGASAQYQLAMQADGGFSSTRFGSTSTVWDGANATTTIYNETFNGGAA